MATLTLTAEATDKLATLRAVLTTLGLTADQARALLLAEDFAETVNEAPNYGDDWDPNGERDNWAEEGREAWCDVLRELGPFFGDSWPDA